jgi:hypothetical protein
MSLIGLFQGAGCAVKNFKNSACDQTGEQQRFTVLATGEDTG